MFWYSFFLSLAFTIVGELLRPKPKFDSPRPSSLGEFQFPTAEETRVIPVIYGRVKMTAPNVVWWGDLVAIAITDKVKTGLFSSTTITKGFQYHLGMQCALCWGGDLTFIDLTFEEKSVARTQVVPTADVVSFTMDSPTLLSSDDPPNGITGPVKVYLGTFTQVQNEYLASKFGEATIPAYRGVCYAVFEHCYLGNNDTVPVAAFVLQRTPNPIGLTGGRHIINGFDANPACMIYEVLTNMLWGASIPASLVDMPSFVESGNTLHAEGYGLSMQIDKAGSADNFISEVLRHVDGVIYVDAETGKWKMALSRVDYDIALLTQLDESNVDKDSFSYTRGSWDETKNTIKATYIDVAQGFVERVVQWQDLANITTRGGQLDVEQIDFSGFTNPTTANNAAARVGKTFASPLAKVELRVNRAAGLQVRPGSVFKLSWAQLGIVQQVFRVLDVDRGATDDATVRVSAMEDIFAIASSSYADPSVGGWQSPFQPPVVLPRDGVMELPYGVTNSSTRYAASFGAQSRGIDTGYRMWVDPLGGTAYAATGVAGFTPGGLLTSDYVKNSAADFAVNLTWGLSASIIRSAAEKDNGEALALIRSTAGDEIVAFSSVMNNGDGTWTVSSPFRGQYDTQPLLHVAGAEVWFISEGLGNLQEQGFAADGLIASKLTPINREGELALASAVRRTLTLSSRALRPYPPANFRFNAVYYPASITGALTLDWAHRDRVLQGYKALAQTAASQGPEAGATYTLKLYGQDALLKKTVTGITDANYAWTTEREDSGLPLTSALLHFDGANGSAVVTDASGKTWAASGNAQLSTSGPMFGTASLLLDGIGDFASTANHADFDFIGENWTIEFWANPTGSALSTVITKRSTSASFAPFLIQLQATTRKIMVSTSANGTTWEVNSLTSSGGLTAGVYAHVAIVRSDSSLKVYRDGVLEATASLAGARMVNTTAVTVGANADGSEAFSGTLDEVRITKGKAVYVANFTPPTAPFAYDASESLNLSVRAELFAVRDGLESAHLDHTVTR